MKDNNTYFENTGSNNLPNSLRVNPFIVPDNYFNELPQRLQFQIHLDHLKKSESKGFSTPEGYFDTLESQLISNIKINDIKNVDSFQVPQGYFEEMGDQLMAQVKIDKLQDSLPEVPIEYFESLSDRILAKIDQEELPVENKDAGFTIPTGYFQLAEEEIMSSIEVEKWKASFAEDGFEVPVGYFEKLEDSIFNQVIEPKVIQMPATKKDANQGSSFKKYAWLSGAAAACIAIFVTINSLSENSGNIIKEKSLALNDIPKEEILNYLSNYSDASDISEFAEYIYEPKDSKGIGTGIEDEELAEYLNYTL